MRIERKTLFTVYSKANCQPCTATKRYLTNKGIPHEVIDITHDEDAKKYVMSLGHQETPVVIAPDGTSFSGFRPDRLKV